ncbi:MAG: bifunctional [glutamate--ammonia ligase]-adenylyl-L-tyrosine phosphorylase/[glutamate--ammonia-ligase] adenylyltransferase [Verrucomicrobia bacterium]|nr:bifunctional [glutamate--ammonia ligase]-adenylyl-L-tyrosine phosphorylase/[glutamate--ammonia-ligase] adenylyltransferase [Verrucomicrobiota bacterium]
MKNPVWSQAIKACADPPRARYHLEQLLATSAAGQLKSASAEQAGVLAALLSGSQALAALLIANPDWVSSLLPEVLKHPRREQGLRREVNGWLLPLMAARDFDAAFAQLRRFKQRQMMRIAARDLARLGTVSEITREISDVADVCLDTVWQLCRQQLSERLGLPYHQDADGNWLPTGFCVLGLGKLGGQELNYSSDVDVIFVYAEEGHVFKEPPLKDQQTGRGLTNHQFFKRLAEMFIAEVTRMTSEGTLYRIDLRLRPEGDAGPLVRSLAGYENYYSQWGQTWERMMLIKARRVAGDEALAAEFLEMIQSFRYPRSLREGILKEVAAMKDRIENEVVKAGEIDRNVKLGRGGIREIEFSVQTLQLLNGGKIPFLQGAQTLPALEKLVQYGLMAAEEAKSLTEAYCFLRDVEHRLQMEDNLQTHTIPTTRPARERLAALMGFGSLKTFEAALQAHTRNVRRVYDKILRADGPASQPAFPLQFDVAETGWEKLLAEHSFRNVEAAIRLLKEFAQGPGYAHVSPRTVELARQLLPRLFALCPRRADQAEDVARVSQSLSDPDRVLTRLDSFITAYGARATLFETWASNPSLFELMLLLFDRSEFLAESAIRTPDLVDELVLSGRLRQRKTAEETLKDLRLGQADKDQRLWLRRYHQAELMRIGLRDILGLADFEQNLTELSALADACLQYALEVALQKNNLKSPPLVIVGLGKLGGVELNYGSDLDICFVADSKTRNLPKLQRLAIEVMDLLSSPTELGVAFITDARLRPDGEKGLLVNTLQAYEEYYRQRARLWEIQSLTRTRPIAGDLALGGQFERLSASLTNFSQPSLPLAAYTPAWKQEIHRMRQRIEKDRTPAGQDVLAIKTGKGGLMDAEFIAQTLCLAHGWQEANTLSALRKAGDVSVLNSCDAEKIAENYRLLRRVEGILRRWSYEGETVLPTDGAALYRVAVRCGFPNARHLMNAIAKYRQAIREVYLIVFDA